MSPKKQSKTVSVELNEAYNAVLQWFFAYPTKEMSLSDLAECVHISKTTANRVVKQLVNEGFLEVEELGRIWRIKVNANHFYNETKKIPYNLSLVYNSDIVSRISEKFPENRSIVLFGSYRKGDDIESSDVDIAVEFLEDKDVEIMEFGIFDYFGMREKVKVNLTLFSRNNIDLNLFTNISNGIVLSGFLEVRP